MDTSFPTRVDTECACPGRDISAAISTAAADAATTKGITTAAITDQFTVIAAETRYDESKRC